MKNILLTGGTGFIGSHIAVELIEKNYKVFIIDNLVNSKIEVIDKIKEITGIKPNFDIVDITDYNKLFGYFDDNKIDAVIHLAGLKAVGESVKEPLKYYENNVSGTINLLKCMIAHNVNNLVFSSSACVYGDCKIVPIKYINVFLINFLFLFIYFNLYNVFAFITFLLIGCLGIQLLNIKKNL